MTLEKRRHSCGLGVDASSTALSRYSFLNSRSMNCSEIGAGGQGRYATLHVPEHVTHAMKSEPQVRQRCPSRSLKPLSTHTQGFDYTPTRTYKIGRSFPAIGLIFSGSIERQPPFKVAIASCGTVKLIYPAPNSR